MNIIEHYKEERYMDKKQYISLSLNNKYLDKELRDQIQEKVSDVISEVENYNEKVINWCNEDGHYFEVECDPYSKYQHNNKVYVDKSQTFYVKVMAMYKSYNGSGEIDDQDEYSESYCFYIPLWRKVEVK